MSIQTPPRLLDLAARSLLRIEASAIAALEYLPTELFPPLFMEAFYGNHRETLKAMVQAWPFVRLPLGGLMPKPHVGTLQAVLDGLDILLAQKDSHLLFPHRRCKLQILDLRNTDQNFWRMWSGARAHVRSSSPLAPVAEDRSRTEQPLAPLELFIELHFTKRTMDEFLTYLLRWVEQRKESIHLCCKKLKVISMSKENIKNILSMVQLDCVQELEVNCTWQLSTLALHAPHLSKMRNVQRIFLSHVHVSPFEEQEQEQQNVAQFTSQFLRLHHLQDLRMESPSFWKPNFPNLIVFLPRCLKTPLQSLSITHCLLTEEDVMHLSQCPNIRQLHGLDLSGVMLTEFNLEPLRVLLEKVAATLQTLDLDLCGIRDSQLEAILPALSCCSELRSFSLCGNLLSMVVIERLLHHTDGLPVLDLELYPAPRESYSPHRVLHPERLAQLQVEVLKILRDLGRPRTIWLSSSPCPHCGNDTCDHSVPIIHCCTILT
uniref:Uncharacterized protein n=1 Tax=Sus scrofa TaxID=9823 RepID=A0A4X1T7H0_PIG